MSGKLIIILISIHFIFIGKVVAQDITAVTDVAYIDNDSLVVSVTLKNKTAIPFYLVGIVDDLLFENYVPIEENYGSFKASVEARKKDTRADFDGDVRDTIMLEIPTTRKQFQTGYGARKIDVFERITRWKEVYSNRKLADVVPTPPDSMQVLQMAFLDMDLLELMRNEKHKYNYDTCLFCGQTIVLYPNEVKKINIDLSYLLVGKATYIMSFYYKTAGNLFEKETNFLKRLGFRRYKGIIRSNTITITSHGISVL